MEKNEKNEKMKKNEKNEKKGFRLYKGLPFIALLMSMFQSKIIT